MKGSWGEEFIEEVRARNDIADVISDYVRLKKVGNRHVGLCPFHTEKTPSFSVSTDKQLFYCFGCHANGDVFSFIMKKEGLDFVEAVEFLARRAGLAIPERKGGEGALGKPPLYRALEEAARYYHWVLLNGLAAQPAREYLANRGVAAESLDRFQIGFAPKSWDALLKKLTGQGYGAELLLEAGLVMRAEEGARFYDRFRGRVMFPIQDQRGQVIGFGGRVLDDGQPKYLNSPEGKVFKKGLNWYGLAQAKSSIRQTGQAIVVEGYLDAIMAHQFGFRNTVASLGTALTVEQARALSSLAEEIIIAYDSDAAGHAATQRGIEILQEMGSRVRIMIIPEGKDPDEFLRRKGADEFKRLLEAAVPATEYRVRLALQGVSRSDPRSRLEATRRVVPILRSIVDPVERQVFIELAATQLGVTEETIRFQVKQQGLTRKKGENWDKTGKKGDNTRHDEVENNGYDRRLKVEREILKIILQLPGLRAEALKRLEKDDFSDASCRLLFERLASSQEKAFPAGRADSATPEQRTLLELVSRLSLEPLNYVDPARALSNLIEVVKENRLVERIRQLEKRINEAGVLDPELVQEYHQLLSRRKGFQAAPK